MKEPTTTQILAIFGLILSAFAWALFAVALTMSAGCRTYNVYQFGLGDNEILVDAEVEKQINPNVKASLK
jgi:hypothetical protein